ncbi:hypothetical protein, partial [Shigella boydii]
FTSFSGSLVSRIPGAVQSRKYAKPGALLEQLLKEAQERVK